MFRFKRALVVCVISVCSTYHLYGQAWTGVLDSSRAVDWSQVGAAHIDDVRTQCVTSQCATVSGGTVTAASINAALGSAPNNTYVLIPAGTFTLSAGLNFAGRSNITLRGSGANSTFLVFSGASNGGFCNNWPVCLGSTTDTNWSGPGGPENTANWTGNYAKGSTSIILDNVSNLSVGKPIILDQIVDQTDPGGFYFGCTLTDGSPYCYSGGASGAQYMRGYNPDYTTQLSTLRPQQQMVNVTNITNNGNGTYTVGITPQLYAPNWAAGHSPGAWWPNSPVYNDGLESLSVQNDVGIGIRTIQLFNCTGCWIKGIRSVRTTQTGNAWGHVFVSMSNHSTIRDSYFYGYDGDCYGIIMAISSDTLSENNILQRAGDAMFNNSDCEGCVAGYNFTVDLTYGTSGTNTWQSPATMAHSNDMLRLFEGNIGSQIYLDYWHGNHVFDTAFRNRMSGREQNCIGSPVTCTVTSGGTIPMWIAPASRYHNIIGNVFGTSGYHTSYKAESPFAIYQLGFGSAVGLPYDASVNSTSMLWGNWDSVTNATRWCGNSSDTGWSTTCSSASEVPSSGLPNGNVYANAVPASESLPASFYLSTTPSWWTSGKAWPPIGPEVTGGTVGQCAAGTMASSSCSANSQCPGSSCTVIASGRVISTPAMDCYFNVMGGAANGTGSALAFDAGSCYGSGGGSGVPNPPSGLAAVVQ